MEASINDEDGVSDDQRGLFDCCCYLADQNGWESFSDKLREINKHSDTTDRKKNLEKVVQSARVNGLRTSIYRPDAEHFNTNSDTVLYLTVS